MLLNPHRFGGIPISLTGLVSYWKMDEASGNAIDSHGTNHLFDQNTVTSAAGKIGNARDFEADSVEYFTIASNASLQTGDIPFTFTSWIKFESLGVTRVICSKDNLSTREYLLAYQSGPNRIRGEVFTPGGSGFGVNADALGAPSTGVWYFTVFWHDPVADKIYIQVNDGAVNETAFSGGVRVSTAPAFVIGGLDNSGTRYQFDGLIDEVGFWKRILSATERTQLYNAGNGLAYPFT